MSWNQPSNQQRPNDGGQSPRDEPPDLEEMLRKIKQSVLGLFFRGKKGRQRDSQHGGQGHGGGMAIAGLVLAGFLILWALSGIFIVGAAENAVILRFGRYTQTLGPGMHWVPRFIESAYKINTQEIAEFPYQSEMLTKDENIVDVALVVQYRVGNPKDFLLKVDNPRQSLQEATASTLRQVIGSQTLDAVLTSQRAQIRQIVEHQLSTLMKSYQTGLVVTDVTLQPAKPPEAVTAAFNDAIKAREDEQRFISKAQAYANRVEPIAQGQAQRLLQEAGAYKSQIVLAAKGDIAGYLALLPTYEHAPTVTRERLYLDTIEKVLQNSTKVLVDVKGSNNLLYLPLDKLAPMSSNNGTVKTTALPDINKANTDVNNTNTSTNNTDSFSTTRPMRGQVFNPDSYVGTTGGNQ